MMSARYAKTWFILSHLPILLNLVTSFLRPLASPISWPIYRDLSRKVALPSRDGAEQDKRHNILLGR